MHINILTPNPPSKRWFNDFFPLIKWQKLFNNQRINFRFLTSHHTEALYKCEILIVDYRYFEQIIKGNYFPKNIKSIEPGFLFEIVSIAKSKSIKTVLFHSNDSCLFRFFDDYENFDLILKKQIFSNVDWYTEPYGGEKHLIWKHNGNFSPEATQSVSLKPEIIDKIKIGWNIGLCDYRYFPSLITKFAPIGTAYILPNSYTRLNFTPVGTQRDFLFSFRGRVDSKTHSNSRNMMLKTLQNFRGDDFILGGKIKKSTYLKELSFSKIGLSPNGHGEICYRDFEIFIRGALLFKTDMSHLKTWPDFYLPNETYIPIAPDYSDLLDKLKILRIETGERVRIASKGQSIYKYYYESGDEFFNHFIKQIL